MDDVIQDLKQFITGVSYQERQAIRDDLKKHVEETVHKESRAIRNDISALDIKLSNKIDDLSSFVADSITMSNDVNDKLIKNQDKRIKRLEHKVA